MNFLITMLATTLLVGCATPDPHDLAPMDGEALRSAFRDVRATNTTMLTSGPEMFYADGTYTLQSRALIHGRYEIEHDQLCITTELNEVQTCRRFARDPAGGIYMVFYQQGDAGGAVDPPVAYTLIPISSSN